MNSFITRPNRAKMRNDRLRGSISYSTTQGVHVYTNRAQHLYITPPSRNHVLFPGFALWRSYKPRLQRTPERLQRIAGKWYNCTILETLETLKRSGSGQCVVGSKFTLRLLSLTPTSDCYPKCPRSSSGKTPAHRNSKPGSELDHCAFLAGLA